MKSDVRLTAAALVVALVAVACSSGDGTADTSGVAGVATAEPYILSADLAMGLTTGSRNGMEVSPPDIDDGFALAMAIAGGLDIRGVVVSMGNGMVAPEMTTARSTVEAIGKDIPVVEGASTWLPVDAIDDYDGKSLTESCVNDSMIYLMSSLAQCSNSSPPTSGADSSRRWVWLSGF